MLFEAKLIDHFLIYVRLILHNMNSRNTPSTKEQLTIFISFFCWDLYTFFHTFFKIMNDTHWFRLHLWILPFGTGFWREGLGTWFFWHHSNNCTKYSSNRRNSLSDHHRYEKCKKQDKNCVQLHFHYFALLEVSFLINSHFTFISQLFLSSVIYLW